MPGDLERIFANLAAKLPDDSDGVDRYLFDETVIPAAPAELASDSIVIRNSFIQRLPGCRGDYVNIIAARSTFRQLGLLALAVLFHERCDRYIINITNPDSRIKHFVIDYKHFQRAQVSGFRFKPWVFGCQTRQDPRF